MLITHGGGLLFSRFTKTWIKPSWMCFTFARAGRGSFFFIGDIRDPCGGWVSHFNGVGFFWGGPIVECRNPTRKKQGGTKTARGFFWMEGFWGWNMMQMKYPRITWRFQILGETYASADQHWFPKRSGLKPAKRVRFSRSKLLCRRFPRPVALEDPGWESSKNHWLGRFGWFICGNSWESLGFWILLFNLCFLCRHGKIDLDLGRISFQGAWNMQETPSLLKGH